MVVYRRFHKLSMLLPMLSLVLSLLTVATPQSAVKAAEHANRNAIPAALYPVLESTLHKDSRDTVLPTITDPLVQQTELTLIQPYVYDDFGFSVAINGDTAVIGSLANGKGFAYVFVRTSGTWQLQAKLTPDAGYPFNDFGISVALEGDTAIVGAQYEANFGSAYVFARSGNTWSLQQKLTASDAVTNGKFGISVSLSGETAVVGMAGDNQTPEAAYVFVRSSTTWTQQQKLTASDGIANDWSGLGVAVAGDTLVMGAPSADAAYIFGRSGTIWTQQQKLTASDGVGRHLGVSVAFEGSTLVVGAPYKNNAPGVAYVFVNDGITWSQQQKLTASDGATGDYFGIAVALAGDTVVVGAESRSNGIGAAYLFARSGTTWSQQQELTASDGVTGDYFGSAVALNGNTVIVGAANKSLAGQNLAGATYIFTPSGNLPFITSTDRVIFLTGTNSFTVTASGTPAPTFSASGLPAWATFDGTTGILSGTPTTTTVSPIDITITASNGLLPAATQHLMLTVIQAPTITSADHTTFLTGHANTFSFTTIGIPAPYFQLSGSVPSWLHLDTPTGVLSGTPPNTTGSPISFTITAVNRVLPNATQNFTLTVQNPVAPTITSTNNTSFPIGSAGTFTVTATGDPTITFSATGLPAWATLNPTTGVLSGTPPTSTGSPFAITITATNGTLPDATQSFTLTVTQAPVFTSANMTTFHVGTAGTFTVTATGNPTPTFSATGVPSWATFNPTTGILSGKPLNSVGSPFAVTLTAANGVLPNTTQNFTLTVGAGPLDTVGVFRPSTATFYLRNANTTGAANIITAFGTSTDLPVTGDWNGDGIDTVGFYRSSTGQFFLRDSNSAGAPTVYSFVLGAPGDLPMAGDWNSDGKDGVGVFRPSNGLIYLKNTLTTGFADFQMVLGVPGDGPVAGDWNGDGKDSPGVYRPSLTKFFLSDQVCNCSVFADYSAALGVTGDSPFAGDWNGDGITGIGVFRPSNGLIYLKNMPTSGFADLSLVYGIANDKPVAGHWAVTAPTPIIAPTFVP
ncbi:MAG: putative Ig domain-containing protein [Chloroflexota bacterium]